jgi:3-hydroxybutyryl-CoA dehydratase
MEVTFSKTVGESDVYLFAGITGDLSPNHVNEQFMKQTPYGERVAHGALIVGYMSTASSLAVEKGLSIGAGLTPVSLGYDRVRFLKPVKIGDTISVTYTVSRTDDEARRSYADIAVTNQRGETVAAATHIMKWIGKGA